MTRFVGIVLVHNEDLFVERAIRNVAEFCDRIHVADHMSTDGTWKILGRLARELDHLDVKRIGHLAESHKLIERYAGTEAWVLGVDGDELYDPAGLLRLRSELEQGAYSDVFRVAASILHCVELDAERRLARGYLAPPSKTLVKLYNFAAVDSWTGCGERLHEGDVSFRPGYGWDSVANLGDELGWELSPFRYVHVCFLRRSTLEPPGEGGSRPNPAELAIARRTRFPALDRYARRVLRRTPLVEGSSPWKREKYMRGKLVERDVRPFFPAPRAAASQGDPRYFG